MNNTASGNNFNPTSERIMRVLIVIPPLLGALICSFLFFCVPTLNAIFGLPQEAEMGSYVSLGIAAVSFLAIAVWTTGIGKNKKGT